MRERAWLVGDIGRTGTKLAVVELSSVHSAPPASVASTNAGEPDPRWLAERLAEAPDPTPAIVEAAMEARAGNELCVATLETFVSILGAGAGNLALKVMATGGVCLGGGILPRILPALRKGKLMETFRRKGRLSGILDRIPLHVITDPGAALSGAVCFGFEGDPE